MPPEPPTLLYTQRQLYPNNCFITKHSQGDVNSFFASTARKLPLVLVNKGVYSCRTLVLKVTV